MKKIYSLIILVFTFTSCEDVIEVDLPTNTPRLSIDALVRLDLSKEFTTVLINANETSSFFDNPTPAELTKISILNSENNDISELPLIMVSPGIYQGSVQTDFFIEGELQLSVDFEGQNYSALTKFVPSSPIISLNQGDGTLFTGNETEVEVAFSDDVLRDDFYLVDLDFGDYLVTEDEFYNGETFRFSYFYDEEVSEGMDITISLLGVDEPFYNYMNQLIVQAGGDQGPFQTPAATVRGNIINTTDNNNFALGYFAVCQTFSSTIVIE